MSVQDVEGCTIDIKITDRGDGTFVCVYTPVKPIKHTIIITWGEVNVPNSPFRVRLFYRYANPETLDIKLSQQNMRILDQM